MTNSAHYSIAVNFLLVYTSSTCPSVMCDSHKNEQDNFLPPSDFHKSSGTLHSLSSYSLDDYIPQLIPHEAHQYQILLLHNNTCKKFKLDPNKIAFSYPLTPVSSSQYCSS